MMSKKVKAKKKGKVKQAQAQQASDLLDGADVEAGLGGMVSPRPAFSVCVYPDIDTYHGTHIVRYIEVEWCGEMMGSRGPL
jgi:hypothetical protein